MKPLWEDLTVMLTGAARGLGPAITAEHVGRGLLVPPNRPVLRTRLRTASRLTAPTVILWPGRT